MTGKDKVSTMYKKQIALLLTLLTCASLFACGGTASVETESAQAAAEETTETAVPAETEYLDTLPVEDMGGGEFRILGIDYPTRRNFSNEEEVGEPVNDALMQRNQTVEENYNVVIRNLAESGGDALKKTAEVSIKAGDNSFDLMISAISASLQPMMLNGSLANLRTMPHMQLEAEWWSAGMYENCAIGEEQYLTMGDISPMKYYAPFCVAYNKVLAEDYGVGDLYQTVLDGQWTFDAFAAIVKDLNRDLDGDGKFTSADFYGYAYLDTGITAWSHYTAMGQTLSQTGADGTLSVNIASENSVAVVEKIAGLFAEIEPVKNEE